MKDFGKHIPIKHKNNDYDVNTINQEIFNEMLQEYQEKMKRNSDSIESILKDKEKEI